MLRLALAIDPRGRVTTIWPELARSGGSRRSKGNDVGRVAGEPGRRCGWRSSARSRSWGSTRGASGSTAIRRSGTSARRPRPNEPGNEPAPARWSASPGGSCSGAGRGRSTSSSSATGPGRIQVFIGKKQVGEAGWKLAELLDLGDLIGVDGRLGYTRTGELTVFAESLTFLAKSLLPPPEKWHGLTDLEQRYRQRYVDLFSNPESLAVFLGRSKLIASFRKTMARAGVRRGRDAHDAVDRRRGRGPAVRHPSQRARHRPVPADRPRAVPQAAAGRRHGAGLRDRPGLSQRGAQPAAQPRVHHVRGLSGLRRLPRDDGPDRGPDLRRDRGARRRVRPALGRGDDRLHAPLAAPDLRRAAGRARRGRSGRFRRPSRPGPRPPGSPPPARTATSSSASCSRRSSRTASTARSSSSTIRRRSAR